MASRQPPFFYHILMNPSSPHLPLPASFVKKHLRNKILKDPILRSANGGYSWKLKMKKFDDDDHSFCFVNGWSKVVKDVGLLFGEFLLFRYVGYSVFSMHVYSVNGCEKVLVPKTKVPRINKVDVSVEDEVVFDEDEVEDEVEEEEDDDVEYKVRDYVEEDDEDVDDEEDDDVDEDDDDVEFGDDGDEDDGEDEDVDVDVDGNDGDPFFIMTSSKRNKYKLRFPPELVALTKINNKETITLKNDDGYEKEMPVRSDKQNKSKRYYVAEGWKEFQRSNDISEGDECVFKFITSEGKLCLAKVTKKKTRATEVDNDDMDDDDGMDEEGKAEAAKDDDFIVDGDDIFDDEGMDDVDEEGEGEDIKLVDNDDEDDSVDGDEGDPSFIMTSLNTNQYKLAFPTDFVALAGINTKETITLKNLDGYEKEFPVLLDKQYSRTSYYLGAGWKEFQRNTNISKGDKFVVKFITSEDIFCLAKVTKKRTRVTKVDNKDVDDDDGMDDVDEEGEGEDVKLVDNDDEDDYVDGDDGDPSFIMTSSNTYQYKLAFPADFVALAGINTKETITLKNLDGYEKKFPVRLNKQYSRTCYYLGAGWKEFQRNTNISKGDKFVVKFITSEDKFCVAKVTKKRTRATEVDNNDVDDDDGMDEEGEAEAAKDDDFIVDGDDVFDDDVDEEGEGEDVKLVDNDDEDDYVDGDDGDPSFILTSSNTNRHKLWFSTDFVALAGINTKETITLKNLDGYEKQLPVRCHKRIYYLSAGWREFQRNTNIWKGHKFVFKFITSEDKFCVAKITKKKTRARPRPPAAEAPVTEVDDGIVDKDVDDNDVELFGDGNPSFVATITPTYNRVLRMPSGFGQLAGFNTKKTLTLKGLDGYEKELPLRVDKKRYYVGMGWKDILQSTSISEGDKCVFKFIASEDKLCLAKIIKNEFNDDDMEDDEDVEDDNDKDENEDVERVDGIDDDDDDNDKDENEDVEPVDDVDPFFVVNITTTHKHMLRLPPEFVELAGIDGKKNIIIKCLDGNERQMVLRRVKQGYLPRYCLSIGWQAFKRSNNISEGDVYVFKYIRSEDKMCLEKITKKETRARPPPPAAKTLTTEVDDDDLKVDGIDDKDAEANDNKVDDENVELVDDGMDVDAEDNKDEDKDAEFVDGNPFFVVTITPSHKSQLRLPTDFVALSGIESKENIIMKSLHRNETQMSIRTDKHKRHRSTQYHLSVGWSAFKRSNNISEGDECVFKYITSEDKMCLAKIIKTSATEVDADPCFVVTITQCHKSLLRLPTDFVALAGIESKENIIMKSLDENETQMSIRTDKRFRLTQYHLSVGWPAFMQSNNILEGDECVFKYITSEDKMCLAKLTKEKTSARPPPLAVGTPPTEVDDNDLNVDDGMDGKDVVVDDNKDEDENVELFDVGMDDKDVNGDDDKDKDENVELVDDRMDDKDVVVDENKDEDENVELVDDGMDGKDVMVDDDKDEDVNVELVDDGMDDKDVNGDDNKDEDENVELVDDRMDDKDVVVDDNKDEDENVELVDDGMDGKDVVVDDNTDKDENVELVDYGMDGKDVVVDDNKDGDVNVELVDDGIDDKDVNGDDNKDEDENVVLVDDGMDVDANDNKDEDNDVELVDGNPFFVVTITPSHKSKLRLPPDFVELAGIDGKKNIIIKCPDGSERQMVLRSVKQGHLTRYYLSMGWSAFRRSNNISEGDECVFKYITSEDKMCLAKITKKETRARPLPPATETPPTGVDDSIDDEYAEVDDSKDKDENVELVDDGMDDNDVDEYVKLVDGMDDKDMEFDNKNEGDENENVELVDDGMDDKDVDEYVKLVDATDNKDGDDNVELVDDRNPFFRVTITPNHKSILRLPPDFVGLAGINTKKNIIVKSLDGNESQMAVRSDKRFNSLQYHLAQGWVAFTQCNNLSQGDECVFKYITSEDKMCLAKVIKTSATEVDADPYFVVTITPCHKSMLWLPTDFVGLAGIDTKENIIVKSLDGNETQMALRLCPGKKNQLIRYRLTMGWPAFKRSNNISEGDECVFKYITSEDKMCLAKVTKEKTQTSLPSPAEVVKRKRGWLPPVTAIKMTAAETVKMRSRRPPPVEITAAEAVKRKRGQPPPSSPRATKDVKRKKGPRPRVHSADVEGVDEGVEVTKKPRGRPSK